MAAFSDFSYINRNQIANQNNNNNNNKTSKTKRLQIL